MIMVYGFKYHLKSDPSNIIVNEEISDSFVDALNITLRKSKNNAIEFDSVYQLPSPF